MHLRSAERERESTDVVLIRGKIVAINAQRMR